MNFGFNFGLLSAGNDASANFCVTEGTDGTWYGYQSGSFGSVSPGTTNDGTLIYANKWSADGTIIMSYGPAGVTQLTGVARISVTYNGQSMILSWDTITKDYRLVDTAITNILIADYTLGKVRCYRAIASSDFLDVINGNSQIVNNSNIVVN